MICEHCRFALSTNTDDFCDADIDEVFKELIQGVIGIASTIRLVS